MKVEYELSSPMEQEDINNIIKFFSEKSYKQHCELIGTGETSEVWRYKDYAIKVYDNPFHIGEDFEFLKRLQHLTHFPKVYMNIECELCVMEYIEGDTLEERLHDYEYGISETIPTEISDIINKVLEEDIVPMDIHASNIIITPNGQLKLIDVGSFYDMEGAVTSSDFFSLCNSTVEDLEQKIKAYYHIED